MNKKFLKALALVGCALLLVTASVVGTLAYLKATTKTVTNTFTAGNVSIKLMESEVNVYGVATSTNRVEVASNKTFSYKLIPGRTYVKDPMITVGDGSESCWLFVKVVNGIEAIEATGETTIAKQMENYGWTALTGVVGVNNVYYKSWTAGSEVDVPVFGSFTIATGADVDVDASTQIVVTAYAVQADGLDTPAGAWTAAQFS